MGVENKMSEHNAEMRETAARICRDYLHGVWKHVTADNIGLKRISGGLSNWLYNVQLPDGAVPVRGEPRQVLLRLYGQVHGERAIEGLITESVIFTLLSERRLGPKLHGIFPGGRIEEYIPARPLLTAELADSTLSALIAEKMGQIHTMQVPISKEPTWLWDTMARCYGFGRGNKVVQIPRHAKQAPCSVLSQRHARGGFDIANHFVEWQYDYTAPEYPFFHERAGAGPTREQQLSFMRRYLRTMGKEGSSEEEERIMMEVKLFSLASHLFWGLWSIVNAKLSQIPFGYWDYAVSRLRNYRYLKERFLASGSPAAEGGDRGTVGKSD
ncbi:hypothetical protein KM043_000167 [Ampulex compressa]|nr:hypothetical protein KM043_000167 [Ampulex compressa]